MIKGESATGLESRAAGGGDRYRGRSGCHHGERGVGRGGGGGSGGVPDGADMALLRETATTAIVATAFLAELCLGRGGVGRCGVKLLHGVNSVK